jgi:hypothetical protein
LNSLKGKKEKEQKLKETEAEVSTKRATFDNTAKQTIELMKV